MEGGLIPDIERAIEAGESFSLRNTGHIRPWKHVIDCLSWYSAMLCPGHSMLSGARNVGPGADRRAFSVKLIVETHMSIRGSAALHVAES